MAHTMSPEPIHLRAGGVSILLDTAGEDLPRIVYWGADLGELTHSLQQDVCRAAEPQLVTNIPAGGISLSLLPTQSRSWLGVQGLQGHRAGRDYSARFVTTSIARHADDAGVSLTIHAEDAAARLGLLLELELTAAGLVRLRASVTNEASEPYTVAGLTPALPLPTCATELLDLTGRHLKERIAQRSPFTNGTHVREGRRGRTGADSCLLLVAGAAGFTSQSGEVWGLHVGWSGNHRLLAERMPDGLAMLAGGEVLEPGEVILPAGASYTSPWLYASYGHGLDQMSARIHSYLRARPGHPTSPRPVTLNVWEAVYFDHDLPKLEQLADRAAAIGVERYVLDDGWFRHRRDDTAGLGDWFVDEALWPGGLHPIVDHVRSLGMQFGLWVEPEMINPDSDVARAHPDWIVATGGRQPPLSRNQQVIDLTNPAAFDYVAGRLRALLAEYDIGYLKWDHNRDVFDSGRPPGGEPAVHELTAAAYRLIDQLKAEHPGLEIESCSSGGGRVDLGILARTDRIWASDSIDAIERQQIQRWTELLVPPEMIGAHVGSPVNHSTGRTLQLSLRAAIAFTGHFGIEWDITQASETDLVELASWIAAYREHRALLHSGTVVHAEHPDPAIALRGVVAQDRTEAIFVLAQLATTVCAPPGRILLPGLDPDRHYTLALMPPGDDVSGQAGYAPLAWAQAPIRATGRTLGQAGLALPALWPGRCALIHVESAEVEQ